MPDWLHLGVFIGHKLEDFQPMEFQICSSSYVNYPQSSQVVLANKGFVIEHDITARIYVPPSVQLFRVE